MKTYILPLVLAATAAVMIPVVFTQSRTMTNASPAFVNALEPAAGMVSGETGAEVKPNDQNKGLQIPPDTTVIDQTTQKSEPMNEPPAVIPAATVSGIAPVDEKALLEADEPDILEEAKDAVETPPVRLTPDKPFIVHLDRNAVNILVGNGDHLRAIPDTNRTVVLIPKRPGSTYFQAIDAQGKIIMQRHVIVAAPQSQYIRVRRACVNGDANCREFTVYHCPDMCHEVSVVDTKMGSAAPAVPDAPAASGAGPVAPPVMDESPAATPQIAEPPPT